MLSFAFVSSIAAQSNRAIERELVGHILKIKNLSGWSEGEANSSENEILKEKLLNYGKRRSVLNYSFPELKKHLRITNSTDGKFRAYSWNTNSGGSMVFFETVYQFVGIDGSVNTDFYREKLNLDPGGNVVEIIPFKNSQETFYILISTGIASNVQEWQYVMIYRIDGSGLNHNTQIIKTRSGITNTIELGYDRRTLNPNRWHQIIKFNPRTKTIRFPIVVEDPRFIGGRITDRFMKYRFNGEFFVRIQ